jgi:two-component system, LytTR family, sensor histidine kinase AgrC
MSMSLFLDYIYILVEVIKTSVVLAGILNHEMVRGKLKYLFYNITLLIVISFIYTIGYDEITSSTLALMVITLLSVRYLFKGRLYSIILVFVPVYLCIACIDIFCANLIAACFSSSRIRLDNDVWRLIYNITGMLFICVYTLIVNRIRHVKKRINFNKESSIILIGVIICVILALGYDILRINKQSLQQSLISFIFALACLFVIIGIGVIILLFNSRELYKANALFNEELINKQQVYYQRLLYQDEEMKRFRHDIKNHIRCLQSLIESDKIKELQEYIKKMDVSVNASIYKYNVGNDLVNCIIANIEQDFKNSGISLQVTGALPENIPVDQMDMCILISNALTNAFEAAQKVNGSLEKVIKFNVKTLNELIYIEITNPVISKIEIKDNMIETTKTDKMFHGYGIANIKECLKKYNGYLEYQCSEEEMLTKILLYANHTQP